MTPTPDRVVDLLSQLIAIPSVNPVFDPESPGEGAMASFIEQWARANYLDVEIQDVLPNRPNVIVRIVRDPALPTLVFESHMDTVSIVHGTRGGFTPTIEDGKVYGRGSCDTKGSMAAMMVAIENLAANPDDLACNVEFLAAVSEEVGGAGAETYARSNPAASAAIVGEPTELRIVYGHKGVLRGKIEVIGKAAHTSVADEGINAIDGMTDVILALRQMASSLAGGLTSGSFTVSIIEGGTGINIVPARCVIQYDRRLVPGDTDESVRREIEAALDTVRASRPDLRIELHEPALYVVPLDTPIDAPLVQVARQAATTAGLNPEPTLVPYGSDASRLSGIAGIPCIVFGPGDIGNAHGADEYVPVEELHGAATFYEAIARNFGKESSRS